MGKSLEVEIEDKFVEEAMKLGCRAEKFEYKGKRGAPDRIVFIPGGMVMFIEFKRPGSSDGTSPHQEEEIKLLSNMGFKAVVHDSVIGAVGELIRFMQGNEINTRLTESYIAHHWSKLEVVYE